MILKQVHVAVGVVVNQNQEVLIAKRPDNTHQGGLWEFPGGKLESGEDVVDALRREFLEEVGLDIRQAQPLMLIEHNYGDKAVLLDVWLSLDFTGEAKGLEGQQVQWVPKEELKNFPFPSANQSIIEKLLNSEYA